MRVGKRKFSRSFLGSSEFFAVNVLFFSGHGLELKWLVAAWLPQVPMTDVVPCECILLRGA